MKGDIAFDPAPGRQPGLKVNLPTELDTSRRNGVFALENAFQVSHLRLQPTRDAEKLPHQAIPITHYAVRASQ